MRGIEVFPLHLVWFLVVVADIAHEFSFQVRHGGEDAASDHLVLYLGEPQFDLVEPGGVGRREVQMNGPMRLEERCHQRGFGC